MWNNTFNNLTYIGCSIMVKVKEDKFEELLIKASQKANELNFKKLVLKSLRMEIKHKDDKEIESLYDLYMATVHYSDC